MFYLAVFLSILGGYLLGSIPFGLVFTKLAGIGDIRKIGSGNIGATNVLRTGRKDLAILTIIFDAGKAGIAAILASYIASFQGFSEAQIMIIKITAGTFAVLGHIFSFWLKFKGGKGIASAAGMVLSVSPLVGLFAVLVWIITALISKYSSLAALAALVLTPIFAYFSGNNIIFVIALSFLVIIIIFRHKENIKRLIAGTETKIKLKK